MAISCSLVSDQIERDRLRRADISQLYLLDENRVMTFLARSRIVFSLSYSDSWFYQFYVSEVYIN